MIYTTALGCIQVLLTGLYSPWKYVSRYGTQVSIQHVDISRYFYKSLQHVDVSRYYGQCSTEQHVDVFRYCKQVSTANLRIWNRSEPSFIGWSWSRTFRILAFVQPLKKGFEAKMPSHVVPFESLKKNYD